MTRKEEKGKRKWVRSELSWVEQQQQQNKNEEWGKKSTKRRHKFFHWTLVEIIPDFSTQCFVFREILPILRSSEM